MLTPGLRPLNVDRPKQGMEMQDTLQFLIGSLELDTDNLTISDPIYRPDNVYILGEHDCRGTEYISRLRDIAG